MSVAVGQAEQYKYKTTWAENTRAAIAAKEEWYALRGWTLVDVRTLSMGTVSMCFRRTIQAIGQTGRSKISIGA